MKNAYGGDFKNTWSNRMGRSKWDSLKHSIAGGNYQQIDAIQNRIRTDLESNSNLKKQIIAQVDPKILDNSQKYIENKLIP